MIRRFLAGLLALLTVTSAEARDRTPLERAVKMDQGSIIVVRLHNNQALYGRLGEVRQDGFTLEPAISHQGLADRELLFQDVRKIGPYKPRWSLKEILVIPVGVVALGIFCLMGGCEGEIF